MKLKIYIVVYISCSVHHLSVGFFCLLYILLNFDIWEGGKGVIRIIVITSLKEEILTFKTRKKWLPAVKIR